MRPTETTGIVSRRVHNCLRRCPDRQTYDRASRRVRTSDGAGSLAFVWDGAGRVTGISRTPATGPARVWAYAYDGDGSLGSRTRPDGGAEVFSYDGAGRPSRIVSPAGTSTYAWDPDDNLVSSALPNGTTGSQTWDRAGRLAKVATTRGTRALVSQSVSRDATGNPTQTVVARGGATESRSYVYDVADRLQGVCYTALSSCTGASAATQWWTYDSDGNRTTEKNGTGAGATTAYVYDGADRLTTRRTGTDPALRT
jgi:YD repeat-containing protein